MEATIIPAEPGLRLIYAEENEEGVLEVYSKDLIVAWSVHEEGAHPVTPDYTWNTYTYLGDLGAAAVLDSEGRVQELWPGNDASFSGVRLWLKDVAPRLSSARARLAKERERHRRRDEEAEKKAAAELKAMQDECDRRNAERRAAKQAAE